MFCYKKRDSINEGNQSEEGLQKTIRRKAIQFSNGINRILTGDIFEITYGTGLFPEEIIPVYQSSRSAKNEKEKKNESHLMRLNN